MPKQNSTSPDGENFPLPRDSDYEKELERLQERVEQDQTEEESEGVAGTGVAV